VPWSLIRREENAREALRVGEKNKRDEMAINNEAFTRRRQMDVNRIQSEQIQNRLARGMAPADAAPLETMLAEKLQERREMLRDQNLMTPDERREQRRSEGDVERADSKARRQIDREADQRVERARNGIHNDAQDKRDEKIKGAPEALEGQIKEMVETMTDMKEALDDVRDKLWPFPS